MHQPDITQQHELLFREIRLDQRKGNAVEREIPGREPWIFPFVGHRHDISNLQVPPSAVAAVLAAFRRGWLKRIAIQPVPYLQMIELLAPQHSGKGLALYAPHVLVDNVLLQGSIKGVCLVDTSGKYVVETGTGVR